MVVVFDVFLLRISYWLVWAVMFLVKGSKVAARVLKQMLYTGAGCLQASEARASTRNVRLTPQHAGLLIQT